MRKGVKLIAGLSVASAWFGVMAFAQPVITDADFARSDRFLLGEPGTDLLNGDIRFKWIGEGDSYKQFDMLIMPNVNHGIAGTAYFKRITQNYFLKHLLGAQLPSDSAIVLPAAAPAGKK